MIFRFWMLITSKGTKWRSNTHPLTKFTKEVREERPAADSIQLTSRNTGSTRARKLRVQRTAAKTRHRNEVDEHKDIVFFWGGRRSAHCRQLVSGHFRETMRVQLLLMLLRGVVTSLAVVTTEIFVRLRGKACGDSCLSNSSTCSQPVALAMGKNMNIQLGTALQVLAVVLLAFALGCGAFGQQPDNNEPASSTGCCRHCKKGKPCGNSCISVKSTCRKANGCACY